MTDQADLKLCIMLHCHLQMCILFWQRDPILTTWWIDPILTIVDPKGWRMWNKLWMFIFTAHAFSSSIASILMAGGFCCFGELAVGDICFFNKTISSYWLFYVQLKNISLMWRCHHYRWRASKFRPMLCAHGLWAGRVLYRATSAVTRDLVFFRSRPKDRPIYSPLTTHKGMWKIYSNPDLHRSLFLRHHSAN
jgi:hypothetical protein